MHSLFVALLAALVALLMPATALADAGDLDAAYEGAGLIHPKVAATSGEQDAFTEGGRGIGSDLVVLGDGSTVMLDGLAGELIKRNPAGDAATGFGDGGIAPFVTPADGVSYSWDEVVEWNGGFAVVGSRASGGDLRMVVAKLGNDGAVDTSFGTDGILGFQPSTHAIQRSEALAATVDSSGRLIVGGYARDAAGGDHFTLARLTSLGALDPTVGDDVGTPAADGTGWVVTAVGDGNDARAFALDAQTLAIYAGGRAKQADGSFAWAVARYDIEDLEINTAFGATGRLLPVPMDGDRGGLYDFEVGGDESMVAGGMAKVGSKLLPTVAHLTPDGLLDTDTDTDAETDGVQPFGEDGMVSMDMTYPMDDPNVVPGWGGMVTTADETVVAAAVNYQVPPQGGQMFGTSEGDWYWARWDVEGATDSYWGPNGDGVAKVHRPGIPSIGGLAADSDGDLFAAATDSPTTPAWAPVFTPALLKIDEVIAEPANVSTDRPSIGTTSAVDGNTLTPDKGTWVGRHVDFTYTWKMCDDAGTTNCDPAVGSANTPLPLTASMVGKWVAPVYTGTSPRGQSTAEGDYAQVMARPPVFTAAPTLAQSGTVPVGTTLTAGSDGDFGPATDPRIEYQWEECEKTAPAWVDVPNPLTAENSPQCRTLSGEDGDSYVVKQGDRNLRLQVFVSNTHLPSGLGASNDAAWSATVAVAGAATGMLPANTGAPAIDPGGAVTEGDTVRAASNGTWTGTQPIAFGRQWQRCGGSADAPTGCSGIPGATGDDYRTGAADVGKVVRLRVTAQNSAGSTSADSTARAVNAKPAAPAPAPAPRPAPPALPAKKPTYVTTLGSTPMPEVRGKIADKAIAMIEQAGIFADVSVETKARSKPLTLNGKKLQPGQVHTQSTSAGTSVTSSITRKHKVKLVVEAGKPGIKACQDSEFRQDLKGVTLEQAWELLEAKRCDGKVNLNFKVAGSEDEPEVSSASKDGKELKVTVTLPKSHAEMDLFPTKSQGAFPADPMPSFGVDDWALTADVQNIFGIRVYDRYIGDGRNNPGARVGVGAEVYLDADRVGEEDDVRKTRADTGNAAIFSKFRPTKAGTAYYLVTMEDAAGQKIFGYGFFKVKQRSGKFSTVSGETYDLSGGRASRVARAAGGPVAHAASVNQLFSWVQSLFQSTPMQNLAAGAKSAGEGLISMAKKSAGAIQFALGSIQSTTAQLIRAQAANVVASGGGNVVSAGGANVVSAGGANVVSAGGANVVAAGGLNLLGQAKLVNGTGSLRAIPNDSRLLSDNGLGLISDNGLGLRNVSKVIAPSEAAPVVAAGGLNLIGTASGNILAQNNAAIIGQNNANLIGPAGGN